MLRRLRVRCAEDAGRVLLRGHLQVRPQLRLPPVVRLPGLQSMITGAERDDALSRLLARRGAAVRRLAARLGSEADAEDVFQHALLIALERLEQVRAPERLEAWFDAIARREATRHLRRSAAPPRALEHELASPPLIEQDRCACALRLLDELPAAYAQILRAVELEEEPLRAFADREAISLSNAGVRLHRARHRLRGLLASCCGTTSARACASCGCEE